MTGADRTLRVDDWWQLDYPAACHQLYAPRRERLVLVNGRPSVQGPAV